MFASFSWRSVSAKLAVAGICTRVLGDRNSDADREERNASTADACERTSDSADMVESYTAM
jgi:hypothetical protein